MSSIPQHVQVLVIGGGPGGSYAATILAREGFDVVVLESAKFPRYHIGESMIPSLRFYLRLVDLDDKVAKHGFLVKLGAAFKLVPDRPEGWTSFTQFGTENTAWNVKRADFDDILLRHAEESGAKVFEQTTVTGIEIEDNDLSKRPAAATWRRPDGEEGRISFDYLIDASGRNGIMSTKYLKNRRFNESLNNVACWGYWKCTGRYMPGTERDNAPWFEALSDESGWGWFIPLQDWTTSVGIVEESSVSARKKREAKGGKDGASISLKEHYLRQMKLCPGLMELMGDAELVDDGVEPVVRAGSDFSYAATHFAGDHYRLVGDAAAFIDPFFSSGVHLALTDALSAALTIASSIRGTVPEQDCIAFHNAKVATAYTKFLVVVLSAYSQMRKQNVAILADIDESGFQRAFDVFNPVIQGRAETPSHVNPDTLKEVMQFCLPLIGMGDRPPEEGPPPPEFVAKMAPFKEWLPHGLNDFTRQWDAVNGFRINLDKGAMGIVPVPKASSCM